MTHEFLERLGIPEESPGAFAGDWLDTTGKTIDVLTRIDGTRIARVRQASAEDYERVLARVEGAFRAWRMVPGLRRGEVVRRMGLALRERKADLGALVTLEMGKIRPRARARSRR